MVVDMECSEDMEAATKVPMLKTSVTTSLQTAISTMTMISTAEAMKDMATPMAMITVAMKIMAMVASMETTVTAAGHTTVPAAMTTSALVMMDMGTLVMVASLSTVATAALAAEDIAALAAVAAE